MSLKLAIKLNKIDVNLLQEAVKLSVNNLEVTHLQEIKGLSIITIQLNEVEAYADLLQIMPTVSKVN